MILLTEICAEARLADFRAPAVNGWTVCRYWLYTQEAIVERRALSALLRVSRKSLDALSSDEDV